MVIKSTVGVDRVNTCHSAQILSTATMACACMMLICSQGAVEQSLGNWVGEPCSSVNTSSWLGIICSNGNIASINLTNLSLQGNSAFDQLKSDMSFLVPDQDMPLSCAAIDYVPALLPC